MYTVLVGLLPLCAIMSTCLHIELPRILSIGHLYDHCNQYLECTTISSVHTLPPHSCVLHCIRIKPLGVPDPRAVSPCPRDLSPDGTSRGCAPSPSERPMGKLLPFAASLHFVIDVSQRSSVFPPPDPRVLCHMCTFYIRDMTALRTLRF